MLSLFASKRLEEMSELIDQIDTEIIDYCACKSIHHIATFQREIIGKHLYVDTKECKIIDISIESTESNEQVAILDVIYSTSNLYNSEYNLIFALIPIDTEEDPQTAFLINYTELNESQKIGLLEIIENSDL